MFSTNGGIQNPGRLPPVRLHFSTDNMQGIQCSAMTKTGQQCSRVVKAEFGPVYCLHHRNNLTPGSGLTQLINKEGDICSIMREMGCHDIVLRELLQIQQRVRMQQVAASTRKLTISTVKELVPYGGYREPMSPTDSIESMDESL